MKAHKIICLLTAGIFSICTLNAQVKVFSSGNILMGSTSTPATSSKVQIAGNLTVAATNTTITSSAFIRGRNSYTQDTIPDYTWYGNDQTGFFHPAANIIGLTIAGSEKMRVHSNGFVGISKTSPTYMLDLGSGDINIGSINNGYRINGALVLTQRNITSSLFIGNGAGNSNTASNITAIGYKALYSNTTGTPNNAFGAYALYSNTTGIFNLAIGDSALFANTSSSNVAIGTNSLLKNTTGSNNTAVGIKSGYSNTTGVANSIFGFGSLYKSTAGVYNAAFGYEAMFNSTNSYNAAFGAFALFTNTTGDNNISVGYQSLYTNSTGDYNSASGYFALNANSTGSFNTAVGSNAGLTNTTGSNNTLIGYGADANGTNYTNATAVGNGAIVTATNKIRVGNTAVTQIGGQVAWSTLSDGRFKTNVQENVKGLEFIKKLRPITYKVDAEALDNYLIQNFPDSIKQMHQAGINFANASSMIHSGFIAQEVEQAAQEVGYTNTIVSTPSNENDVYALSYSELVVPLVKAMQEQSSQVDSLTTITHKLDSINRLLQNQINDIINNCCQRKITPTTVDRSVNSSAESSIGEQSNWLAQNKPNPFNKETVIDYNVVQEGNGSILIFDMNGKLLKTISIKIPGKGSVTITANDLVAGMYYYTLVVNDNEVDTKKMILTQ